VVVTSVLDEDPPCLGVGGLCKIPPVWTKFIGTLILAIIIIVYEARVAGEMA